MSLHRRVGRFVKLELYFASKWILISEVIIKIDIIMIMTNINIMVIIILMKIMIMITSWSFTLLQNGYLYQR